LIYKGKNQIFTDKNYPFTEYLFPQSNSEYIFEL
jgi:hypothetical protein